MSLFEFSDSFPVWDPNGMPFSQVLGEEDPTVNRPLRGLISWSWSTATALNSLLWDVLVGDPGMVGRPVGEDDKGGLFPLRGVYPPPECRRNMGEEAPVPSWNPGAVSKLPFLGRPIAKMAGELWTRMICLSSAPGSERSVIGTPMPAFDWRARAVRIGELSGGLETKGSIFDRALRMVRAAGRASSLLALVFENPANAGWFKPEVISDPFTCSLIAWAAVVSGVGDPLGMNCVTCFCVTGLLSWLTPLYGPGLLVGLLPTDGFAGVPPLCFLAAATAP